MSVPKKSSVPLPPGFAYEENFLSLEEERGLLEHIRELPFRPFEFQGYAARRRVVSFGYEYNSSRRQASPTEGIPGFLNEVRIRSAQWSGLDADELVECIVTEYPAGAPIGWHRDFPKFEDVLGISLHSRCRMRFKPYEGEGGIASAWLEPRSIYAMRGDARWKFQHSIPDVEDLRYSVTFRTLRKTA